mgnify:CR=1 FL=1
MFETTAIGWGGSRRGVQSLFIITVISYVAQIVIDRITAGSYTRLLGLSLHGIVRLHLWQLISYQFVHGGLFHLLVNMFMLAVFGKEIEDVVGTLRFVILYLFCGLVGGIGWLVVSGLNGYSVCVGASGALFGIAGAFAAMFPHREMYILLFFVLPVRMTARMMAIVFGLISLLAAVSDGGNIAHAAHLAGGVAGYIYGMILKKKGLLFVKQQGIFDALRLWMRRNRMPPYESDVNRVLEKISQTGMDSLTKKEMSILERSKRYGIIRGK